MDFESVQAPILGAPSTGCEKVVRSICPLYPQDIEVACPSNHNPSRSQKAFVGRLTIWSARQTA